MSILFIVVLLANRASAQTTVDRQALLERVGRYVQDLQQNLAVVISDETYHQDVYRAFSPGRGRIHTATRTIRSEMLFMWLAQEDRTLSIRNVLSVDGRPIADSKGRLDRALALPGFDYVARLRALKAESARYDIGHIWRTTGEPDVVLRFLLPINQSHFLFTPDGVERVGGELVTKLRFTEQLRPTAIDFNGEDVVSRGAIWVRPADGTIVRTHLTLRTPLEVAVTVEFRRDPKLAVWAPVSMAEHYTNENGGSTVCAATYTNYRRFETSGRVINPQ